MSNFHSLSNKIDLQQIACMWLGKCWFLIYTVLVQGACIIVDGKFWRSNKSLFLKDSKMALHQLMLGRSHMNILQLNL